MADLQLQAASAMMESMQNEIMSRTMKEIDIQLSKVCSYLNVKDMNRIFSSHPADAKGIDYYLDDERNCIMKVRTKYTSTGIELTFSGQGL